MAPQREDHLRKGSSVTATDALIAGSVSGAFSRAITAPLDTIKIRMQLQVSSFYEREKLATVVKNIWKNEGIMAFWRGNVPAEIMYIVYGGCQFTSYSVLNTALNEVQTSRGFQISESTHALIAGIGSGIASTLVIYPLDLLRTRLVAHSERNFLSMINTSKNILQKDGIMGFFAGIKPAILSVATTTGLTFYTYQLAREYSTEYPEIPFIEAICGFVAGASAKGITFPLDTLRKRIQMLSKSLPSGNKVSASSLITTILRNEGVLGVYKGFGISVLKTAPTSACSIYLYELSLNYINRAKNRLH